jgi:uncharacterized NAD-dependent epimerase/dehydratase family protein
MTEFPEGNAIVYCEGGFATTNGKTAHGLIRRTKRYKVLSVIDSRYSGKDAGEVLDGRVNNIPIYEDVKKAVHASSAAGVQSTHLVVGLAPDGGRLSSKGRDDVKEAIKQGLNIDCGLHDLLSDDREIMQLAKEHNVWIRDIRKPPPREELHFFCGKIEEVDSLKIAVLGTDSAVGKRTTAWILVEAFERSGLSVELIGTGQTAWMQGVRYGLILDALIVDFVTGEIEHAVWQAWRERQPDIIIIEGQGSLLNPAYPGGIEILSAGRPDIMVLQHAPARKEYDGFPGYALHPIDVQIRALEVVSQKPVGAITINHEDIPPQEISDTCRQIANGTGLPVVDVLQNGAEELLPYFTIINSHIHRKYLEGRIKSITVKKDTLDHLVTMDTLEIGPLDIKKDRFKASYTVRKKNLVDSFDLIYRYEEEVFKPDNPISVNLASMIASQVALNYGLFCNTMIFHGFFDKADGKFIREMLENTAREIYVKKFLEPNIFLHKLLSPAPLLQKDQYSNAELVFQNLPSKGNGGKWDTSDKKCGILLSGGKESLLSYSLLDEIGLETYPIFINESGRHWYTALNSYRYFKENVPRTARVWTNSDRLFSWMLRHIPYVRPDFADMRADDYPIRLWTVAVFLFGALPLLQKKGTGYLVIGDEYDTSPMLKYHGITHFDGLYDQSRYFDLALSGYFNRKGWNIKQFSIVRPLSELLVLKMLIERYTHLQRHQVSCHMAHIEGNRVFPCGRCEKCHRIVAMLSALGADPTRCGYSEHQIEQCLARLPKKNLHQESVSSRHTLYLLAQKNAIQILEDYKPSPEVESLRFDKHFSPPDIIPEDIRDRILRIQLEHAKTALRKSGEKWVRFDPLRK